MTGAPAAILDAGPITAERTAAISGVAISRFAPRVAGRAPRAALIGAGVQGRSHLAVLGHVLPGVHLSVFDRHPDRAAALADARSRDRRGSAAASVVASARDATADADVVVTAASFGPVRQVMTSDWLAPDALVVPVDYATYCAAEVAATASLFLVDQREQFLANRDAGLFEGYPDPAATIGEAIVAGTERPARTGRRDPPRRRPGRPRSSAPRSSSGPWSAGSAPSCRGVTRRAAAVGQTVGQGGGVGRLRLA